MKKTVSLILTLVFILQTLLLLTSCEINVTFPDVENTIKQTSENISDTKDGIESEPNAIEKAHQSAAYQYASNAYQNFISGCYDYYIINSMVIYMNSEEFWFVKNGTMNLEPLDEKPSLDGFKILESYSNKNVTIYVPNNFKVK